ncbi:tRNA pseudouridine(38-40) synthase TruA [Sandaracinobacter neustonicus]|uniref:tRNA pseudouridine synthase A n=2 Tax=Sandaracinobacter neustonicus TaxID=1715348 RepID=A0A501XNT2_9SPHN|nr:tRNA pseudouridine(38-40) synthase TruA [Sandaracinobacter neustonicus]
MGWQRQPHGPSVQQAVETALAEITGEQAVVHAAGRTDTGVHASGMVAHAELQSELAPFRLMEGVNARLKLAGQPVAVLAAENAGPDFHARFSCTGRAYEYRLLCRRAPLTWNSGLVWRRPNRFDIDAMNEAARHLLGQHDFTTFRHVHCQAQSPVKTLDRLWVEEDGEAVTVHAAARSFLHHQVRSMVGSLVLVGEGRWRPSDVAEALAARNRAALRLNAPPDGLWFVRAEYRQPSE